MLALLGVMLLVACETTVVNVVELSRFELSPASLTLLEGEEQQVDVLVVDAEGATIDDPALRWTTADPDVATVSEDGLVRAHAPGRTTLEASSGDASASAEVTVLAGPAVRVRPESMVVETEDDQVVTRTVEIENAGSGPLEGLSARVRGDGASTWLAAELVDRAAPTQLRLRLRPAGLAPGEYEGLVVIESATSMKDPAELRIRMRVREASPDDDGGGDQDDGDQDRDQDDEDDDQGDDGDEDEDEEDDEEDDDGADATSCVLRDRSYFGNLEIDGGTACELTDVRVFGNVLLSGGARLTARNVRIEGNVSAQGASGLDLVDVHVTGNFTHRDGGEAMLRDLDVQGNSVLRDNRGRIELRDGGFGGHVDVRDNRGGPFLLVGNRIEGHLDCRGNSPEPVGGDNQADGGKRRQCSGL